MPVNDPDVTPANGEQFIGYMVVTLSSEAGTKLVYTRDGTKPICTCMPTCKGPRDGDRASEMLSATTTVKALSCRGEDSSNVVTRIYDIQPGPVVRVSFQIAGSMSASDVTESQQGDFVDALVIVLGISPKERVQGVAVSRRRQLLDVSLSMVILSNSDEAAQILQKQVEGADFRDLTARAGWLGASVSGIEVSVMQADGSVLATTTPPPADDSPQPIIIVATIVGALFACTLVATGTFYIHRRRVSSEALAKEADAASATLSATATFVALEDVHLHASTSDEPDSRDPSGENSSGDVSAQFLADGRRWVFKMLSY